MSRYDENRTINRRIEQQTEAEFVFGQSLEDHGIDYERFMQRWNLTLHDFNGLAHTLYGVQDETLELHPALCSLMMHFDKDPDRFFQGIAESLTPVSQTLSNARADRTS